MGRTGPQLPLKKCAVIITTFFGTKPLCSHDYARLQVQWRPSMPFYSSRTHTVAAFRSSTVLPGSFSSLSVPAPPPPMFVSERIFAYLPPYADGFCRWTLGNVKPTPRQSAVDCLRPFVVKGFCEFSFLRVSQSVIASTALVGGVVSEISVNGGTCKQQEKQRLCCTRRM